MMFDRKKGEDLERLREESRLELEREREKLQQEREALETEKTRLEQLRDKIEAREDQLENLEDQLEDLEDTLEDQQEELEDAESVKELLDVVSDRIPTLITDIQEAVYSPEQSRQMALSVAEFHKTLVEAGMPERDASALTITHMQNLQHTMMRQTARVRLGDVPKPPAPPEPPAPEERLKRAGH